jgi:hypothetical protein
MTRASSADAARRLQSWIDAGYSSNWISSATGVPITFVQKFSEGRRQNIGPVRSELILKADIHNGTVGYGPAVGTTRRLQALAAIGWTVEQIHAATGVPMATLSHMQRGNRHHIRRDLMLAVKAHFAKVSMTPGPSSIAKNRAAKLGWAPPLAWDDIDDPNDTPNVGAETYRPHGGQGVPVEVLVENIQWLLQHDSSLTTGQLAERLGYRDRSAIQNALGRHGYRDLLDQLVLNQERAA